MTDDKRICLNLTMEEVRAYRKFIGKTTLGQIPDVETASTLRKIYLKLTTVIDEVDHEG